MYRDLLPSLQNVGLGLAILFQGVFRHLRPLISPQPATKKSSHRKWESGAWAGEIVLGSFQALVPPYLAAAGHQKIQPQEMRIWGLGLRNCCREFSGTCAPLSGRSRPPKIQPEEMRIWGLGLRNCFREFSGIGVPLSGPQLAPKNPAAGNENLSLAKLSEIPTGTFFIIWAFRPRNCEQKFGTDSLVL